MGRTGPTDTGDVTPLARVGERPRATRGGAVEELLARARRPRPPRHAGACRRPGPAGTGPQEDLVQALRSLGYGRPEGSERVQRASERLREKFGRDRSGAP